jgi:hypothetical protein
MKDMPLNLFSRALETIFEYAAEGKRCEALQEAKVNPFNVEED